MIQDPNYVKCEIDISDLPFSSLADQGGHVLTAFDKKDDLTSPGIEPPRSLFTGGSRHIRRRTYQLKGG
jgi:hypothetical protein